MWEKCENWGVIVVRTMSTVIDSVDDGWLDITYKKLMGVHKFSVENEDRRD